MKSTNAGKPLVVITGCSGLIGSRLMQRLDDAYQLVGLDVKEPDDLNDRGIQARWFHCDMTDDVSVDSALQRIQIKFGAQIASVIHLAAYYDFSGEPSPLYRELTVEGTRRLLRALQSFHVEQFVFSSTLLVMKSSDDNRPVDAYSEVEAEWEYPQSKLAAEQTIHDLRGAIPTVRLRMAGVYDEDCHSLPIAQQISRIYEKQLESYLFPGDKTHGQAFIHLDDLADCFRHVVDRRQDLEPEAMFVIGEEDVMSYEELQGAVGQLIHGKEWPAIRIPKTVAKVGAWVKGKLAGSDQDAPFIKPWMIDLADQNYPVSISRARTNLDWEPRHTLRHTLAEMIDRLHRDPRGWYETNGLPVPDQVQELAHSKTRS
jgi:nucleoside-diphosphate-sugar epimerase